jgi:ABC-type multidrug transport system permease subunit
MDENTPKTKNTSKADPSITQAAANVATIAIFITFCILSTAAVFGAIGLALRVGKWMVLQGAVR